MACLLLHLQTSYSCLRCWLLFPNPIRRGFRFLWQWGTEQMPACCCVCMCVIPGAMCSRAFCWWLKLRLRSPPLPPSSGVGSVEGCGCVVRNGRALLRLCVLSCIHLHYVGTWASWCVFGFAGSFIPFSGVSLHCAMAMPTHHSMVEPIRWYPSPCVSALYAC